ncbi:uncharacterized protein LOC112560481 isoform X3 [Pomacea canaliculata]|nr:uncharacterized protein LOC112560481 isoform X3 [Pomacea canaliculata]XP_025088158.1 uncharacterized protein LOC112560481 isoform X3 [Pomacea canaliculata]XP_025088160.1 uncharacterized protein LOC112560481 isoform X3 [Pomacea canaliculata]
MSKELPSTHGTTGTFGIPIDRSWYRYEQDFNTVLSPPPLVPPPYFQLPPETVGKLKKSYSQPSMNVGAITLTSHLQKQKGREVTSTVTSSQRQELMVTSALMPNHPTQKLCNSTFTDALQETNSSAQRYETGPVYSSSKILSSFQKNLRVYGHELKPREMNSLSAPPSPKLSKRLDNALAETDCMAVQEKEQRLSKVTECVDCSPQNAETSVSLQLDKHGKWASEKSQRLEDCPDFIKTEFSNSSQAGSLRKDIKPLSSQLMDWLSSPKSDVKINKKELNALTPTSF